MALYDPTKTWQANLDAAPAPPKSFTALPPVPGEWSWCGLPIDSPLGVPAGPLLDARWLLHYANLGFDWLVYKTVRTSDRACYGLPNLVPVDVDVQSSAGQIVQATSQMGKTWAVSFGMPSQPPDVWRRDVEWARTQLPSNKRLIVSVVGTQSNTLRLETHDPQAALAQLADDFALAARWAKESGADGIEANFSCPNVNTPDAQLHQQPRDAALVAKTIRQSIGSTPLVLKIGHVVDPAAAAQIVDALAPFADGLAMTNSIAARVRDTAGHLLFEGNPRGICGGAIRQASVEQLDMFRQVCEAKQSDLDLIGVGGIFDANDLKSYLSAGADSVGIATAAMVNPNVALEIRKTMGSW